MTTRREHRNRALRARPVSGSGRHWRQVALALLLETAGPASAAAEPIRIGVAVERDRLALRVEGARLEAPQLGPGGRELGAETLLAWVRPPEPQATSYRIQIAALADGQAARALADELGRRLVPAEASWHAETGTYRVRGGRFATRDEALAALAGRVAGRWPEGFVVEAEPTRVPARFRLALAAADEVIETAGPVALRPSGAVPLALDGRRYRGAIEIRVGTRGLLVAVNELDSESYLRGVVPLEMGPELYPELEALKAQAVAARTYALASRGGFLDDGYDLCATARCQVYGGADVEAELSDRAVAETAGLVLAHAGAPIKALFSATCGGHTEAVENVFEGDRPVTYLGATPCAPAPEERFPVPAGRAVAAVRAEDGRPAGGWAVLLWAAGLLESLPSGEALRAAMPADEARALIRRAATRAGATPGVRGGAQAPLRLGGFLVDLVEGFGLAARGEVLLRDVDLELLGRHGDASSARVPEQRALAVLGSLGVMAPHADGGAHLDARPSRAQAVVLVGRLLRALGIALTRDSVLLGRDGGSLLVRRQGELMIPVPVGPGTAWLREAAGELIPLRRSVLLAGEGVSVVPDAGPARVVVVGEASAGSDDRRARDTRWTVRLTRAELESRLASRHAIGRLLDIEITGRGASGRPLAALFRGSDGEARLEGYNLKRVLSLKDDLLVVEPIRSERGELEAVRFAGRGWGHGVGLCQEGAFGLALRGYGFRAILERYYRGAELVPASALGAAAGANGR